jgi:hypothetical protein
MKLYPRVLATSVAFLFIAASCASTGDTSGAAASLQTKAAASPTAQVAAAPKFLIVVGDTIRSQAGLNDVEKNINAPGIHCTEQSRFPQGGRIVWRMKVIDPTTGKYLDDKAIASFTITYPDGKTDKLVYGAHGGTKEAPQDFLWAVGFTIPADYPTGAFNVKIEAKSVDGATGTFDAFKVSAAQLTIVKAGQDYPRSN